MTPMRPIFWHQGLFLQPQHFQYNDQLHAGRLTEMLQLLHPYPWGAVELELDVSALQSQQVVFQRLRAVLRDGTIIDYPGNTSLDALSFRLTDLGKGKNLFLGMQRMQPDQPNVNVIDYPGDITGSPARFTANSTPVTVADQYADGPEGQLQLMSYAVRLFWDDEIESAGYYELLPLARILPDGDGAILDATFIPPCLIIAASVQLQQQLRQLRDEILARARQLEVFKPSSALKVRDADASHNSLLMALAALNRLGAQLHHLLELPQAQPWQADGLLRQLIGELSTFSDRCNLLGEGHDGRPLVPQYRHETPGLSVQPAIDLIRLLLTEIAAAPEMLVRLLPAGAADGYYHATLPDGFFAPRQRYHLVVTGEFDPSEFAPLVSHAAKLAAPSTLEGLVTHALPGIELVHLPEAPRGIPRRSNALYFLIDPMSEAWEALEPAGEIAMFMPDAPVGLQIEVIVSKW